MLSWGSAVKDNTIEKDYLEATKYVSKDIYLSLEPWTNIVNHLRIRVKGFKGTPYENGEFIFEVKFGRNYPYSLPYVYCHTKIWHPNIDPSIPPGKPNVCFDIILPELVGIMNRTYDGPETKKSLLTILDALKGMIQFQKPFFDEDQPINEEAGEQYKKNPSKFNRIAKDWTIAYANENIDEVITQLETAEDYLNRGDHEKSVTVAFLAMEEVVKILLLSKKVVFDPKNHRDIMYVFVQKFVQTGHIPGKVYQLYNRAFGKSLKFDRRSGFGDLTRNQVEGILKGGIKFVKEIRDYMKRNNLVKKESIGSQDYRINFRKAIEFKDRVDKLVSDVHHLIGYRPDEKKVTKALMKLEEIRSSILKLESNKEINLESQKRDLDEEIKAIKKMLQNLPNRHRAA